MAATLTLVSFNPNPKLSPSTNLKNFILYCRCQLTLWATVPNFTWDANVWPENTKDRKIKFTNWESRQLHPSKTPTQNQLMDPNFADVAKSYMRYRHTLRPHNNQGRETLAFKALEKALMEDMAVPDITKIQVSHYNRAAQLLSEYSGRQNIVASMQQILVLLSEKLIVPAEVVRWQNPYIRDKSYDALRGGNAPAEVKLGKVADQDAFFSIADVFSLPVTQLDDSDVMVTSITALLLCAPMRIGETLRWRADCLRSDTDTNGDLQRYLAYYVPKTHSYTRKPVPTTMSEVAQMAVDRLVAITDEGRRLARYMETSPTRFYRHADCPDIPDDQELTPAQLAQALGFAHAGACEDFMKKYTGNYKLTGFTLDSLWQIVLAEHHKKNPHFPYQESPGGANKPLKMSESLMCCKHMQFGARASTSPVLLAPFNPDHYRKRLDGAVKEDRKNQRPLCFFTKHGFDPMRMNSHSLRHFVNRLAKQGGMSAEAITEWSTRASVQQTRTYLHESDEQKRDRASKIMGTKQEHHTLSPVTEEEATSFGSGPYHRSRYGICRRSWAVGPCNKFADCTNCSELLACKGDRIALEAIKADRDNMIRTRDAAQRAIDSGERSASLWLEKAKPQIYRLVELVNIMENPDIPDGSAILLTGTDFNHESQLVAEKASQAGVELLDNNQLAIGVELVSKEQLARDYGQDLVDCLEMLL
ncbi:integrase [Pseudomonas syringae pv. syringae]|uniref:Integrase n=1 Tax=Pseudomonas amygdali pv. mori TaxID=34065 RepID=A0A3M5IVA3_PSEA0|nr:MULTISPECIES: integrase [Pseudomonas syringae group]MCK9701866.1 integrase [Pseudomonas syringae pv. syringae]MCK9757362.1 integrase [Pseudomonas syringae pv. syringae]MCK9773623.1 integrase [Pseudomonas syringae pv. syringae]RMT14454.1 hypothetical protein ALP52_00634 [Pseudomonas amygdali pv. mori]